ncbi:hypothetical protein ACVW0Q_002117 [Thermostichus sp. MS-CIW-21]|jgi:hypothetical protein
MDSLICVTQAWSQQRPSCFAGNNEMGGRFPDIEAAWVCWATASGELVPTEAELERQRAEQAEQRAGRLARKLRELGVDLDAV